MKMNDNQNDSSDLAALAEALDGLYSEGFDTAWGQIAATVSRFCNVTGDKQLFEYYGYCFKSNDDHHRFRRLIVSHFHMFPLEPKVLIVAGGSGAGKTTLARMLLQRHEDKFTWLRRCTTRPARQKDSAEEEAHRFMTDLEFEQNRPYLYGVTNPYGYKYEFLLEDLLTAHLLNRIWIVNVMIQFGDIKKILPRFAVRVVGLEPIRVSGKIDDAARCKIREAITERIMRRDPLISIEELEARVEKSCRDTEMVHLIADRIVVNQTGAELQSVYAEFEASCFDLWPGADKELDLGELKL